jgi:hypothetical protein
MHTLGSRGRTTALIHNAALKTREYGRKLSCRHQIEAQGVEHRCGRCDAGSERQSARGTSRRHWSAFEIPGWATLTFSAVLTTVASGEAVSSRAPPRQASPVSPPARRLLRSSSAVIAVYALIGVAAFWPVYPGISQRLFGTDWDFTQSVWFLDWVPHALTHGLNPFFSNALMAPTGVNLAQNTASPLLGLIAAPFDLAFSPTVSANLLMLLAMPVSATAAFVVLRKWRVWGPARRSAA